MERSDQIFSQTSNGPANPVLYFLPAYLETQRYSQLKVIKSECFFSCFAIEGPTARSLPQSPFGGILSTGNELEFRAFQDGLEKNLQQSGVNEIIIHQPPTYYNHFVPEAWLLAAGYQNKVSEYNQFIIIDSDLNSKLHRMQRRKLKHRDKFHVGKTNAVSEIYRFIARCRAENGLVINISEDKLRRLVSSFPTRYEFFEARRDGQLAAAVIMTRPTDTIAYYYLPATDPDFKKWSPMVSLMDYLYSYYKDQNFLYLDLGISSVEGNLQKSLYKFKERMGACYAPRNTWGKLL